ncbi:2-hydroxyacid dehydrogenase [Comamonas nitrativorans]|uniref:2-hydroxyacid dehydrogenase n=1 Tax=Comamonas nitrativorans TaxID=108437 RepID=A0ABV9GTB2_9BURK
MPRPHILIARAIAPQVVDFLREHFEVQDNQADVAWDAEALIAQLQGKDGLLATGIQRVDAVLLAACPRLKAVANMTVGYNNFDVAALTAAGVQGSNTPDVLTETTADFGFALLMATARRITEGEHFLRAGKWREWRYDMLLGAEVHGSTLGILGMGRIGQAIARRAAKGFGMRVLYHNRSQLAPALEVDCCARYVDKETLLRESDHVMLVLPFTPENHHAIGAPELALMRPGATLVNIARGGIVDDAALARALRTGQIAAAGLDVFEGEPQVHPDLLTVPNVVLTPHIASATEATRRRMCQLAADNLVAVLQGQAALTPINTPDPVARAQRWGG